MPKTLIPEYLLNHNGDYISPITHADTITNLDLSVKHLFDKLSPALLTANIGEIFWYPSPTPPPVSLPCDGSPINPADYPELTAVLGSNTLPDLQAVGMNGLFPYIRYKNLIPPDMVWVSGYCLDRSLAANTWTTLTPVADAGDTSLVSGNDITIPQSGMYNITVGGAMLMTTTLWYVQIDSNLKPGIGKTLNTANHTHITTLCRSIMLEKDEHLTITIHSAAAQSSMGRNGAKMYFNLVQLF